MYGLSPSQTTTEAPPTSASSEPRPLTSVADLPGFTCTDSGMLIEAARRTLYPCLPQVGRSQQRKRDRRCCPGVSHTCQNTFDRQCLRITASSSCIGLSDHGWAVVTFSTHRGGLTGSCSSSLSVLNLEDHLGLVISPQSPLSAGYITLRACRRSLPLRFSTVTPGGIVGVSHRELPVQYSRQTRGSFKHPCPPWTPGTL